jgi:hypothetical protein
VHRKEMIELEGAAERLGELKEVDGLALPFLCSSVLHLACKATV